MRRVRQGRSLTRWGSRRNAALCKGRVGAEHADAVATAAGRLDESQRAALFAQDREITEHAASSSPETFRRWLNRTVNTITRNDDSGMFHLFAEQPEFARMRHDQLLAYALDRIVAGQGSVGAMAAPKSPC